ncbi:kinesin-like protein KIF20B isoform X2 [Paralichthys olivaceus]|uniref:kinesin-like protein KIF20B isoform X2 n=1 Tax=Paralichthys olivaceus TaxID=8255 RepID=UPI0037514F55
MFMNASREGRMRSPVLNPIGPFQTLTRQECCCGASRLFVLNERSVSVSGAQVPGHTVRMMESSLNNKAEGREQLTDEPKNDISSEFSTLPQSQNASTEERDHLQVFLRIRPFTSAERSNGESLDCVAIESPDAVLLKPPCLSLSARQSVDRSLPQTGQRFQFSQVYGPETSQKELFEGTVKDLVKNVLEGGNSLVFTYGVTNAGKTFTFLGPDADAGILPRSLDVIFSSIDEQVFTGTSIKPHRCREFTQLSREQQVEEEMFKRNFFRTLKESDKSNASLLNSTNKTLIEGASILGTTVAAEDKISLDVETHTKFSVWVSFCEIYNENIHDLLEVASSGTLRRTVLRLSQDVKGNAFVKDLRWVQVNSAEEAYKVMKLGKKNQSFSSTRLNQLSSRSHSIFSIRILRIEDIGTPRVHTVSELCLCDLAGSERCAKTQNKGERLKEAGNINTSLLILGKCINAMRNNQQAKLLQHVPFRESKLTHYLQGFFCGRGKACMIVNINQCASMYDETLNVLKFSAVAQKVVVLFSRPLATKPQRSAGDVSFIVSSAERKVPCSSRGSSTIDWESSLEDIKEYLDNEYEKENNPMEETVDETGNEDDDKIQISKQMHQKQVALLRQLQIQLKRERAEGMLIEARVREETSREYSDLFSEMQIDYNERLVREREILEERAERRLEIFKNLIDKMTTAGTGQDAQDMDKSLDPSSDSTDIKEAAKAARKCLGSCEIGAVEELERKVLELYEHQEKVKEKDAHKHKGETIEEDEEKMKLLSQLQEKSSEVSQLEKQVEDLQRAAQGRSSAVKESSPERDQLQEALAALQKEKKAREDVLSALEYQTSGKEEALASLEEERKAREDAITSVGELRRGKDEAIASLEKVVRDKEEAIAALAEVKESREVVLAALSEEKSVVEEARCLLEKETKKTSRLEEEREKRQQQVDSLQQEVRDLTSKLEAAERQVTSERERAEQVLVQLDEHSKQLQVKTSQIHVLTLEAQNLKLELEASTSSSGSIGDQLRDEASVLRKNLADEKEKHENKCIQTLELERELHQVKEQLEHIQQLEQFNKTLHQQHEASLRQVEELGKKLQEQEVTSQQTLDDLRSKLEYQECSSKEDGVEFRAKLDEQTQASEKQSEELKEKLREQQATSQNQLEELKFKLSEQQETSDKVLDDLKLKFSEQEKTAELLKAELEEARSKVKGSSCSEEEVKRLNSELQTEVAALREKLSNIEAQLASSETTQTDTDRQTQERASEELQKKLLEKEARVTALQKSLQEALERREEEEIQAVQEARRREVERRRELLAVAHEAIAQKDEELEKRGDEINRLKENAKQSSEKVESLGLELQRKEDDASDLREKLADYKKQVQQVQKEISTMREEEKVLRQKLTDTEKTKKQLQSDVANRDRTIQQLKLEQSCDTKSDQTLQLYQKSCKELEVKERMMEDMRLALMEQEETQAQMEDVLEQKLNLIQELTDEVEKLKGKLLQPDGGADARCGVDGSSQDRDVRQAKQEAAQAQEKLKLCTDKHQAERKKWLEEKLSLIGQAKEAEDKRNQEMRKFAEDRERYARQQSQTEALSSQLTEKDQTMETWRKERDTLVAALEVQLQKLLSSQAEKDKLIQELRHNTTQPPPECDDGAGDDDGVGVAALQAALREREADIQRLKEELKASTVRQVDTVAQLKSSESPAPLAGKPQSETISKRSEGRMDTRASVSSQGSAGFPSVLDSSEISTENGRMSRFPRPELEISFSPLQPNRMALRRQGEESAVTVKITRSARKRKSGEMEKSHIFRRSKRRPTREEVEAENRRNTRTKLTTKLTPHKEETSSPAGRHDSRSSLRSRKEGTLQKIGDFLQSSPTLLGTKAKKMMSLVSGRVDADSAASSSSSSSLSLRTKKNKRKLYRPEISSPMDMPSHPIISREPAERESDHQIIRRRLRSRVMK